MKTRPCVIAIDPGFTTGIAHYCQSGDCVGLEVDHQDVVSFLRGMLNGAVAAHVKPIVVIERFIIGQETVKHSPQYDALELIGAVINLCREFDIITKLQTAADAKNVCTDAKLKKLGWFQRGMRHANDAKRHLLLALITSDPGEVVRLMLKSAVWN